LTPTLGIPIAARAGAIIAAPRGQRAAYRYCVSRMTVRGATSGSFARFCPAPSSTTSGCLAGRRAMRPERLWIQSSCASYPRGRGTRVRDRPGPADSRRDHGFRFYDWRLVLLHELCRLWNGESLLCIGGAEQWLNEGVSEFSTGRGVSSGVEPPVSQLQL